ncbi:hypothetical protein ACFFJN_01150 [Erwinia mallotivora]|uniref:hypothetical protein n=1 Tax=Erwinia mallotivora TaxID=69222 RepID=UPI0035F04136
MDEYIYHITKRRVAFDYIKTQGLVPAARSSGTSVARQEGAFASEGDKNLETKVQSKLTVPFSRALKNGYSKEQIENKNYMFTGISLNDSLERDDAYIFLSNFETHFYQQHFPQVAGTTPAMNFSQLRQRSGELASDLLKRTPQHDLCRFAREIARLEYAIEEKETANHIYFFESRNAATCYPDYTGHYGGAIHCRVLRVKRSVIKHLEQDMAESRGLMTRESVTPQSIEIYNAEGNPFNPNADDRWVSITEAAES